MTTGQLPPIKGFIETSFLDWPGQVCAVIFLPYCNLRCPYCHNHRLVLKPDAMETVPLESIIERVLDLEHWIDGICVTGGEPTIHRGLPALLATLREAGFKVKLDTNGTQPEMLKYLIAEKLIDSVAMDVKAPLDDESYERCAGVYVPAGIIMESIEVIMAAGIDAVFRSTVCPSLLSEADVYTVAGQLKGLGTARAAGPAPALVLQNFSPSDTMDPALKEVQPYTQEDLSRMQDEVDRILAPA